MSKRKKLITISQYEYRKYRSAGEIITQFLNTKNKRTKKNYTKKDAAKYMGISYGIFLRQFKAGVYTDIDVRNTKAKYLAKKKKINLTKKFNFNYIPNLTEGLNHKDFITSSLKKKFAQAKKNKDFFGTIIRVNYNIYFKTGEIHNSWLSYLSKSKSLNAVMEDMIIRLEQAFETMKKRDSKPVRFEVKEFHIDVTSKEFIRDAKVKNSRKAKTGKRKQTIKDKK